MSNHVVASPSASDLDARSRRQRRGTARSNRGFAAGVVRGNKWNFLDRGDTTFEPGHGDRPQQACADPDRHGTRGSLLTTVAFTSAAWSTSPAMPDRPARAIRAGPGSTFPRRSHRQPRGGDLHVLVGPEPRGQGGDPRARWLMRHGGNPSPAEQRAAADRAGPTVNFRQQGTPPSRQLNAGVPQHDRGHGLIL